MFSIDQIIDDQIEQIKNSLEIDSTNFANKSIDSAEFCYRVASLKFGLVLNTNFWTAAGRLDDLNELKGLVHKVRFLALNGASANELKTQYFN